MDYLIKTNGNMWNGFKVVKGPNFICVKNGVVKSLLNGKEVDSFLRKKTQVKIIDCGRSFITPGFIDAHTHLLHSGDRSFEGELRKKGASYVEILKAGGGIKHTVSETKKSTTEELKSLMDERFSKMQSAGTTTIEVKTGYGLSLEEELHHLRIYKEWASEKKVRVVTTLLMAHAFPENKDEETYLEEIVTAAKMAKKENLASRFDVFLEDGAFSKKQTEFLLSHACSLDYQITLHAGQFSEMGGAEIALKYGAASIDHAEHLKEGDEKKLAESGVAVGILPICNIELDTGVQPNARKLLDAGVELFLATDFNAGSSFCTSLLEVGKLASRDLKMSNKEILKAITSSPAKALGLKKTGKIEEGSIADIGVWKNDLDDFFSSNNRLKMLFVEGNKVLN
tara:strand:+ start:4095 stop:5285 length:1191 start_codon:yes stop_codon:yes gene_type:complete